MSQAVQSAPRPAPAAAPATAVATTAQAPAAKPARSTPQRLRWLSTGLVVAGLVVGLVGALVFTLLTYSLARAQDDTEQLIRVQKIQTNLLGADATATNAFLVGGLEPPAQRAAYDAAISESAALIAEAAQAQPADTAALSALNQQLTAYAATIEQARANNRQGLPVGAQYLRTASAELRSDALPILDLLVSTNADRADDGMDLRLGYLFVGVAVLGLAAAVLAHIWLSRRFRRRVNVGVLAAAILLLASLVTGLLATQQTGAAVAETRSGSFAAVKTAAQARIGANDAKSNESLTLIARGSGSAFEQAWTARADQVRANLDQLPNAGELSRSWSAYTTIHTQIRSLDDGGSYDAAVAAATGGGEKSANTAFNAFDTQLDDYLQSVSTTTATALSSRTPGLVIAALLTLLTGLGAAFAGRAGVEARRQEYR